MCDRAAHALAAAGITKGMRTVLMVTPGTEFFAIAFALFKIGALPVMVDPGMGINNLGRCLGEAEPEAFVGTPKAHAARLLLRWAKATLRVHVTVGPKPLWGGHRYARLLSAAPSTPFDVDASGPEQLAAPRLRQAVLRVDSRSAFSHRSRPRNFDKKSFSIANWPILAWSFSTSFSLCCASTAFPPSTSSAPSTRRFFQSWI